MARMGRPKADTKAVLVRFPEATLEDIDEIRRLDRDLPSRPEVIRQIVHRWLSEHPGVIPGEQTG